VGQRSFITLTSINVAPAGCFIQRTSLAAWVSSDPTVANITDKPPVTLVTLRAVSPGDTMIFADGVQTPSGPVRAPLAYCPGDARTACVPVNLMLRVVD
jgi:hypothetical protein